MTTEDEHIKEFNKVKAALPIECSKFSPKVVVAAVTAPIPGNVV